MNKIENNKIHFSFVDKIRCSLSSNYHQKKVEGAAQNIFKQFEAGGLTQDESRKILAKYNVKFKTSAPLVEIDRKIAKISNDSQYHHPENQEKLKKWTRNGFDVQIFIKYPEFCDFLERSGLLSQMKVSRDQIQFLDDVPAILVNGDLMKWTDVQNQFKKVYSSRFSENFIQHKETREIYTYLDNGRGLQPHHPYLSENTPTSRVNDEEYDQILNVAQKFVRKGEEHLSEDERAEKNKDRTFVIQIVSSYVVGPNTRAHDLLQNRKHPYIRVIVGNDNHEIDTHKGDVYDVGFGWKKKHMLSPFGAYQGMFRSPDIWEYQKCKEKVVTNIPVTQEEAAALRKFTLKYHRDSVNLGNEIGFHLARQNCSVFVRKALESAGIAIPTEITLPQAVQKIVPKVFLKIGRFFKAVHNNVKKGISKAIFWIPRPIKKGANKGYKFLLNAFVKIPSALFLISLSSVLGGANGSGGRSFDNDSKNIAPSLKEKKSLSMFANYKFNLPGVLQEWQREQPSTQIFKDPVKFAILNAT